MVGWFYSAFEATNLLDLMSIRSKLRPVPPSNTIFSPSWHPAQQSLLVLTTCSNCSVTKLVTLKLLSVDKLTTRLCPNIKLFQIGLLCPVITLALLQSQSFQKCQTLSTIQFSVTLPLILPPQVTKCSPMLWICRGLKGEGCCFSTKKESLFTRLQQMMSPSLFIMKACQSPKQQYQQIPINSYTLLETVFPSLVKESSRILVVMPQRMSTQRKEWSVCLWKSNGTRSILTVSVKGLISFCQSKAGLLGIIMNNTI